MYYDLVKSTFNANMTCRIGCDLIWCGYDTEEEACADARELIVGNTLDETEAYEVEVRDDDGSLKYIIDTF